MLWPSGYKVLWLSVIFVEICVKLCYNQWLNSWVMCKNVLCEVTVTWFLLCGLVLNYFSRNSCKLSVILFFFLEYFLGGLLCLYSERTARETQEMGWPVESIAGHSAVTIILKSINAVIAKRIKLEKFDLRAQTSPWLRVRVSHMSFMLGCVFSDWETRTDDRKSSLL